MFKCSYKPYGIRPNFIDPQWRILNTQFLSEVQCGGWPVRSPGVHRGGPRQERAPLETGTQVQDLSY